MTDFTMPDVGALAASLEKTPLESPPSDKGRFFNQQWWPKHHKEVEGPVLRAIERADDPSFDRRVSILRIAERIDAKNGGVLAAMGFTPTELTRYVTRAMNKRLRSLSPGENSCYVIRNQKLVIQALEDKSKSESA